MLTIDVLRLAVMGLWRRKLRAALTIIGVIIGTLCIIIMVSLGLTNIEQFNNNFIEGMNLTEIRVSSSQNGTGSNANGIMQSTVDSLKRIPNVQAASGTLSFPVYITYGNYEADLYVTAEDAAVLGGVAIKEGAMFSSGNMPELLLGSEVLKGFNKPGASVSYDYSERGMPKLEWQSKNFKLYLGYKPQEEQSSLSPTAQEEQEKEVIPKSKKYAGKICGLIGGSENSQYSYQAYIALDTAKKLIRENRVLAVYYGIDANKYSEAVVMADDIKNVAPIMKQIRALGYEAYSQAETIESVQTEQARQQGQLTLIAAISLLVSAIGIANTMLTSILERRAQIGVMKVVGLKISKIRAVFLTEAALIGFAGGIIGIVLSYIFAWVISGSAGESVVLGMYFEQGMSLVMPFWLVLAALGIAVFVGVLSGIYPAVRATRMSPLEAIRG